MSKLNVVSLSKLKRDNLLDEQVKMEIVEIDAKILNAHEDGLNTIAHPLPTKFMVNENEMNDAKIYVYAELISTYKENGFTVKIMLGKSPKIFFKWENKTIKCNMDKRRQLITDCLVK